MRLLSFITLVVACLTGFSVQASLPTYSADVSVDVTAENAAAARDIAMNRANRQALTAIAANFTTREGLGVLNKLNDDQLLNFIKETTVLEEKTSNVRYLAKLRITANDQILRQYLQEKNVPLVVASSADVMVIPVFRENPDSSAQLWEQDNPWRLAWEQNPPTVGSVRFFSPEQKNVPFLSSADQALTFDAYLYQQLSSANNKGDVYLAEAYFTDIDTLTISVVVPQTGQRQVFSVAGPRSSELFKQAVQETGLRISDQLKGRSIVTSNESDSITVLYKYDKLSSWLKNEEKISAITAVQNIEVNAIGNGKVQFKINFVGGLDTLRNALQTHHLLLTENQNYYTLLDM